MAVKKYKAKSIHEAISRIKEDLGQDAMILSTKKIPKSPRDPYAKEFFEVTAQASDPKPPRGKKTSKPAVARHSEVLFRASEKPLGSRSDLLNYVKDINRQKNRNAGIKEQAPEILAEPVPRPVSSPSKPDCMGDIRDELSSIKDMLFLSNQGAGVPAVLQNHPECINVYVRLVKSGLWEQNAESFLKRAWQSEDIQDFKGQGNPAEKITENVIREILASVEVWDPFDRQMGEGAQVAAFVGPTGVGKTTTIAKLAAELSLKRKKTVGLISIDSYRIGALEQLKTYSSIMGLPCLPAFTRRDLEQAMLKMEDRDIILIDTAGHSHLDGERMTELGKFINGSRSISTHLVLSAATGRLDMMDAAENFSVLKPKSYLFTKVDETRRCGNIIDQITHMKMPVSFIANGQRVPEDLVTATKKDILHLVLRQES